MAQPALQEVLPPPIEYPASDGKPMAETDEHRDEMFDLIAALREHFRGRDDVYVSGNLFIYYREGDPSAVRAPDVFVVVGVAQHRRRTYKLWEEREVPTLVIEVTSRETRKEDLEEKYQLYAELGVEDYFLYDPQSEYLEPALQGHHLEEGDYQEMLPDPGGRFVCARLGLLLTIEGRHLRLIDAATGEALMRPDEFSEGYRRAQRELEEAERARVQAERSWVEEKKARAEAERARAQAERERAEAEVRAARAEVQAERLRRELDRLRGQGR